jgi:Bacterial regulatory proteins, luxR family
MTLVVSRLPNKHVAAELGMREKTVKLHRRHVMLKIRAERLAELVRMAERLGIIKRLAAVLTKSCIFTLPSASSSRCAASARAAAGSHVRTPEDSDRHAVNQGLVIFKHR